MNAKRASPGSQQRLRVFEAYRGRGRRTNDLWLVYSPKTDRDWILSSNRQLVHWLVYLESCPSVRSFNFSPADPTFFDESSVQVTLANGTTERHVVGVGALNESGTEQIISIQGQQTPTKFFTDVELEPRVKLAMRWLKAIAFAAAIRDNEHAQVRLALVSSLHTMQRGLTGEVIDELVGFDEAVVYGMLVRLAIEGHIVLDLANTGFCLNTPWYLHMEDQHVVA